MILPLLRVILLTVPRQVGMRSAGTCADVGLGGTACGENNGCTQQDGLRRPDLLVRFKDCMSCITIQSF